MVKSCGKCLNIEIRVRTTIWMFESAGFRTSVESTSVIDDECGIIAGTRDRATVSEVELRAFVVDGSGRHVE